MRNITITQKCVDELLLSILKEDLKACEDNLADWKSQLLGWHAPYISESIRNTKKDIKTLKRAINFYSVQPPYDDV